jgi:hypothetical protein
MGRKLKTSAIAVSKEATAPQVHGTPSGASIWINLNDCTDSKDDDKQEKREASPPPVNLIRVQETQDDATLPSPSIEKNKKEDKVKCDHCNKSVSSRCLKYYHRCKADEKPEASNQRAPPSSPKHRPMRSRAETMVEPELHTPAAEGYPYAERINQALIKARVLRTSREKPSIYNNLFS